MANWLNEIRSESTPGDEIAIYCLSNMYLRHVYVKTSKWFGPQCNILGKTMMQVSEPNVKCY